MSCDIAGITNIKIRMNKIKTIELFNLFGGYDCSASSNAGTFAGLAGGGALFGGPVGSAIGGLAAVLYITYHCPNTQGYWG